MKKTILFCVACFAVLLAGCLPQEKLTGRVIDTAGPVSGAAVLGMVWVEDAAKIRPAPVAKDLKPEDRDAVLTQDMKERGLPAAYARAFSDDNGWFKLDNFHFSAGTKKSVKAMRQPKITRITMWAFQRGYRKQAVTLFPKQADTEISPATMLVVKPENWKDLYVENTVDSLTQDYMLKGYSKEFGATKAEKSWILKYTLANEQQAYETSNIKGDPKMEEMCGHDYSDIIVSSAGIQRNPAHEKCGELLKRIGAIREIEDLWVSHSNMQRDPLAAAKEVVKQGIALLPAEATEPREYEAMIVAGIEDARKAQSKESMRNGLNSQFWQDEAKALYVRGDKSAAYRTLGYTLYAQLSEEIKNGVLTAQAAITSIPGIKDTTAGFYLLMNRPLTAQLPGGDNGGNGGKTKTSTDTAKEEGIPIEEYVPKVIINGKWGTSPGEFGVAGVTLDDFNPISPTMDPVYPSSLSVDSNGDIYVLDTVNNRIQKFNEAGEYLREIPIESWSGYVLNPKVEGLWESKVTGINIVIDSKDTLYYYLKLTKDGKETGEVWEFKKDRVVKKTPFDTEQRQTNKFKLDLIGNNQWELALVEPQETVKAQKHRVRIKKETEGSQIIVEDNSGKLVSSTSLRPSVDYFKAKTSHGRTKYDVYFDKVLDNGNFRVRTVEGTVKNIVTEEREYTPEGKLVRRIKSPPGYSHGIEVGETGVKIVRWVIQKSN